MDRVLDQLQAGSAVFAVERLDGGFVLVADPRHGEAFSRLVRELMNQTPEDFVVLPVADGRAGYERAVIVPF